ncbi:mediator of RNA polymerase II transcription subunit 22 isoform X3 [Micractinium conductrix]|uniref:Mediator of RNA polymerase II transcription subunit 22 isoform X3 n=1 Tax=Micractinium conductrix TaxID=554055 RepID=A0A2P6V286_9CHLO|nr:mediator of RNA polymerase II transcription subunit 22 isoform X3 [Micractinium conductrix]|eukprot:PSC68208.1 mediator of RNA polymerase II transcription subunit 22 isoform X3 [Micractinium conductrix]
MATAQLKDRVREQYSQLLEAFANLLRSARLPDEGGDAGSRQGRVPGELMEVFAEKMLAACQALLGVVAELKRNALLNDVHGRNAEVASSAAEAEAEAAALRQQLAALQQRLDATSQLVPPPDAAGIAQQEQQEQQAHAAQQGGAVPMEA